MKSLFILVFAIMLSACSSKMLDDFDQWQEDLIDKYPEMKVYKAQADELLEQYEGKIESELFDWIRIRRQEAEMLGELHGEQLKLKKKELEADLAEAKAELLKKLAE